jgi:NhaP-type Na+/H+ or K+/H+ antiporter
MFAYVGLNLVPFAHTLPWAPPPFLFATLALSVATRLAVTAAIVALANRFRADPIPPRDFVLLWVAGSMRGAVSVSLSLNLTTTHAATLITSTITLVLVTILLFAALAKILLRVMKFPTPPHEGNVRAEKALRVPPYRLIEPQEGGDGDENVSRGHAAWRRFDARYLKPLFGGGVEATRDETAPCIETAEGGVN